MTRLAFVSGLAAGLASVASAQTATPPSSPRLPPPACTAAEHRQFDFWVGYWDVYPSGKTNVVAHSLIEKLYGGCTIRENWMPLVGGGGGSLNMYSAGDKRWHQTWHDSQNSRVEFDGGLTAGKMVLLGFWPGVNGPGKDGLVRMTYSRNGDGSVRQFGEVSEDHGLTWSTSFDFTYRKSTSAPPK